MNASADVAGTGFLTDIKEIQRRAREYVERGAVTQSNTADIATSVALLNAALATEIVCVLRYMRHYYTVTGPNRESIANEFHEHAREEQEHADRIAERITQLGGSPNLSPEGLATRSHSHYDESDDTLSMIRENLIAERVAIETYAEMIRYFGDKDPTSRRLLESILEKEEEHATDMTDLLTAHQRTMHAR